MSDHTFRYAKLGTKNMDYGRMLENIVAIELLRRGYEVYAGVLYKKEIDFVAIKRNEKIYIQVCVELPTESTRETDNLMEIKDHYHKYVVCRDTLAIGNDNGIEITHIADFLLKEKMMKQSIWLD